jgi:hypothetical protein
VRRCGADTSTPQNGRLTGIICRRLQITVDLLGGQARTPPCVRALNRVICVGWERLPALAQAVAGGDQGGGGGQVPGAPDLSLMAEWVCDPGKPPAVFVCPRLVGVAPAVTAWWKTASRSPTMCRVRLVAPSIALGVDALAG